MLGSLFFVCLLGRRGVEVPQVENLEWEQPRREPSHVVLVLRRVRWVFLLRRACWLSELAEAIELHLCGCRSKRVTDEMMNQCTPRIYAHRQLSEKVDGTPSSRVQSSFSPAPRASGEPSPRRVDACLRALRPLATRARKAIG